MNLVCCRVSNVCYTASGSILTFTRSNSKMRIFNLRKYPYFFCDILKLLPRSLRGGLDSGHYSHLTSVINLTYMV